MTLSRSIPPETRPLFMLVLLGMCAVIGSALAFEHIGGYIPCKLCLQQRIPWYTGIPVALLSVICLRFGERAWIARGLMLICGAVLLWSLYLGINHAGVEWGFWEGPGDCGAVEGGIAGETGNFLQQLETTIPPSCNEAALRIFGLSFAGWNAIASAVLAVVALAAALRN